MTTALFLTYLASLFAVMNPFGAVPIFVSLTKDFDAEERKTIALKTSMYVAIVLIVSFLSGKYILNFFGINILSLKLGGGILIAMSGFSLMRSKLMEHKGIIKKAREDAFTKDDPSITPLAMPMLAGPGSISYLISLNEAVTGIQSYLMIFAIMALCSLGVFLILRTAHMIAIRMGAAGITALSRFIGFIIVAIGIEYILGALEVYIRQFL